MDRVFERAGKLSFVCLVEIVPNGEDSARKIRARRLNVCDGLCGFCSSSPVMAKGHTENAKEKFFHIYGTPLESFNSLYNIKKLCM